MAPAPDVVGLDVIEIWTSTELAFLEEGGHARILRKINKYPRMSIGKGADDCAASIFVN